MEYVGFKPFTYQRDVIDLLTERGKNRIVTVLSRRQTGKSTLISNLLLFYAINFAKSKNFCVSPTLPQAKNVYQQIIEATSMADGLITKANGSELSIEFCNGSIITFKSAAQGERLRGFTSNGLICIDEAAFIDDDVISKVMPWRDFYKANMLIVSTPFIKNGFFYKYYCLGLERNRDLYTVDWTDPKYKPEMDAILPPETLEMYRKQLPENQFKSEYLGQFLDDDGMVFSHFRELVEFNEIKPTDKLFVGIDWSLGTDNDFTAVSMMNQYGKQVYLSYWNDLTPTETTKRIVGILLPILNQIAVIEPETNSLGGVYTDDLKAALPSWARGKVVGFNTSNETKNAIVNNLQKAFEEALVRILGDTKQLRELSTYLADFNPKTRKISYSAPQGLNDDTVIALMLSYDAYLTGSQRGIYSFSKIR